MNPLEGSLEAPEVPGLPFLNHSLSQFHRQKPNPYPLLEEAVNEEVRVTSGWWRLRNFLWMEVLSVTAGGPPNCDKACTVVCWMWRIWYLYEWPFHLWNIWNWWPSLLDMILDTVTHVPVNSLQWPPLEIISSWVWMKNAERWFS